MTIRNLGRCRYPPASARGQPKEPCKNIYTGSSKQAATKSRWIVQHSRLEDFLLLQLDFAVTNSPYTLGPFFLNQSFQAGVAITEPIEPLLRAGGDLHDGDNSRVSSLDAFALTVLTILYRAFIAGGIAACGAVTATHPFETVKIR